MWLGIADMVATAQGPIWKSIKWLDELGMSIIEQVRGQTAEALLHAGEDSGQPATVAVVPTSVRVP